MTSIQLSMTRLAGRVVVTMAALLVVAAACTGPSEEPPDAPTGPPPREQWAEDMAACMTEKGWDSTANPDNSFGGEIPEGVSLEQYNADLAACRQETGHNLPRPPINHEMAEDLWDEYLAAAECVEAMGYPVEEPPSRQFAVEALQQDIIDLGGWNPHAGAAAVSMDDLQRVQEECPVPAL